jgi:hypothetical protein
MEWRSWSCKVSTGDQSLNRQMDDLTAAGTELLYSDIGSGKKGCSSAPVGGTPVTPLR